MLEARRALLKAGKSLKSTEVVTLDQKIVKLQGKLQRFAELGEEADDIDDDDDSWFDDVLMPIKKIASAFVRLARKYDRQAKREAARVAPVGQPERAAGYAAPADSQEQQEEM